MYHSIATFTFREGTTASQVEALAAALKTFAFDNEVALRTYLTHPEHAEISRRHVEPILAGKHNAQFIT